MDGNTKRYTTLTPSSSSPTSVALNNSHNNDNNCDNNPRSCILQVGVCAGRLCEVAITMDDKNENHEHVRQELIGTLANLMVSLWTTACSLQLNLIVCIRNKMKLNAKKYPVEHCKGKAGKYTEYSHLTGITETNQVTEVSEQHEQYSSSKNSECRTVLTLAQVVSEVPRLADEIANFANDRLWSRYHTPRNLVLALLGEVGELSELLQWANDSTNEPMEPHTIDKLSQELADCSIYLLRLATVCNVVTPLCATLQNRNN